MTYFQAYLLTRLDSLGQLFAAVVIISLIISFGVLMGFVDTHDTDKQKQFVKKVWKITLPICFISLLFGSLIPTTKEAAFVYIAPKIINNKDFQETITKLPRLSNLGLEYLSDLLEEKNNTE